MVLIGEFNEAWEASETFGSVFIKVMLIFFNEFILEAQLVEVDLGGYVFTWMDMWASKMSELYICLRSNGFLDIFGCVLVVVLDKFIPNHRPIVLKEKAVDFGPTLLLFFNLWLHMEDFHKLVIGTWLNDGINDAKGFFC